MWDRNNRPKGEFSQERQDRMFIQSANQVSEKGSGYGNKDEDIKPKEVVAIEEKKIPKQTGFRKLTKEEYKLIVNSSRYTEPQKRVVQLYFDGNLTSSQIAQRLNQSNQNIHFLLHRIFRKLPKEILISSSSNSTELMKEYLTRNTEGEEKAKIMRFVDSLAELDREVYVDNVILGKSIKTIARERGVKEYTASKKVFSVRSQLRKLNS